MGRIMSNGTVFVHKMTWAVVRMTGKRNQLCRKVRGKTTMTSAKLLSVEGFCPDIAPCRPAKVDRRFGGTYCLHLQGQKVSHARNHHEAGSKQLQFPFPAEVSVDKLYCISLFYTASCHKVGARGSVVG
jgi:hypothetical protein